MKKLIASLMAIGMMGAACLPAAADTTITEQTVDKTGDVNFKYTKSAKYSVTIPAEVTISTENEETPVNITVNSDETDIGLRSLIITVPKTTDVKNTSSETVGTITLTSSEMDPDASSGSDLVAKIDRNKFDDGFGFKATLAENTQMDVGDYTTSVTFTVSVSNAA